MKDQKGRVRRNHAEERRRQFEESRGLSERRVLPLYEDPNGEEPDRPKAPQEGESDNDSK